MLSFKLLVSPKLRENLYWEWLYKTKNWRNTMRKNLQKVGASLMKTRKKNVIISFWTKIKIMSYIQLWWGKKEVNFKFRRKGKGGLKKKKKYKLMNLQSCLQSCLQQRDTVMKHIPEKSLPILQRCLTLRLFVPVKWKK